MIYLATEEGVIIKNRNIEYVLKNKYVNSIVHTKNTVLAGSKEGIFRSTDKGKTWKAENKGLEILHIRKLFVHPNKNLIFAGTEPASIFYSEEGGINWNQNKEVDKVRDENNWFLFYSPEAGCVRGFAFNGKVGYGAVEVGGLLKTTDYGKNWELMEDVSLHNDVHDIFVPPSSHELVYAATGGGLYTSQDAGKSWNHVYNCYCQSAWVDPKDPSHIIFSSANSSSQDNGKIEESFDAGKTWQNAMQGTDAPWKKGIVTRFLQKDNKLYAVVSNKKVFVTTLDKINWKPVFQNLPKIHDLIDI